MLPSLMHGNVLPDSHNAQDQNPYFYKINVMLKIVFSHKGHLAALSD
jgi:hypothetical protein